MTATFYAQPYDISAEGFYFHDEETFNESIGSIVNAYGQPVEELEIQFIDGTELDCALARALCPSQCNVVALMDAIENWSDEQKINVIIAVGDCGYTIDLANGDPDDFEIDIYRDTAIKELAYQFVDEGLFGEIPDRLTFYLDYEAIARDLAMDYTETVIAGELMVYRAA